MQELYGQGAYGEVITQGRSLLESGPDNTTVHHLVGRSIIDIGWNLRTAEAISHLEQSMKGLPDNHWQVGWSHVYIGMAYQLTGQESRAIERFQLAIAVDATPECTTAANRNLRSLTHKALEAAVTEMQAHYGRKDYAATIARAEQFVRGSGASDADAATDDSTFHHYYGRALVELEQPGRLKAAVKRLQASLDGVNSPSWMSAWNLFYMGLAQEKLGQLEAARGLYEQAIALDATPQCTQSAKFRLRHLGKDPYADWRQIETDDFVLHFPPDSPIASRPAEFGRRLDAAHGAISRFLLVRPTRKIQFWLFNDAQQGRDITGAELGFADRDVQAVYQHLNQTIGHEMTHCICHYIVKPPYCDSQAINEGLAVYLDQTSRDKHAVARRRLAAKQLPAFEELESSFRARQDGYPLGGSFTGFLLEAFSRDQFLGFWRDSANGQYERAFKKHYNKTSAVLSEEWKTFLKANQ
jgi:tetratricopeptide (TPR) repeat protein